MEGDLIILCPDGAWPQALNGILSRPKSLCIREILWHCVTDPLHDSSPEAAELLRPFLDEYSHAIVIRDFEGSGWEERGVVAFREAIVNQIAAAGWDLSVCKVLIAEPELEAWLRLDSIHLQQLLKERARKNRENLDQWQKHLNEALILHGGTLPSGKACRPKEVFRTLLAIYGIPPANSLFSYLAIRESLKNCSVESFQNFVLFLQTHFGELSSHTGK